MAQRIVRAKGKIRDARHPVPGTGRGRAARPAPRGARRRVPDLQRGLHGQFRRPAGPRRPVRGGGPAGPAAGRADARRARGLGPAGPDAADRVPPAGADRRRRRRWCCSPTRTAPAGTRRWSPRGRRSCGAACAATARARTRSRPRSTPCTATRRRPRPPTGGRSWRCTTSCMALAPSPVVALNRAVAVAEVDGPAAALALVDAAGPRRLPRVPRDARRPAAPTGPDGRRLAGVRRRDRAYRERGGTGVPGPRPGRAQPA